MGEGGRRKKVPTGGDHLSVREAFSLGKYKIRNRKLRPFFRYRIFFSVCILGEKLGHRKFRHRFF